MQGEVYQVARSGVDDDLPHPHVVVIEFDGSRDSLVVPAYSAEGFAVERTIEAARALGYPPEQVMVELDNALHIQATGSFTGRRAWWLTWRAFRISQVELQRHRKVGVMDRDGLRLIATALLELARVKPERFSGPTIRRLRQLIKSGGPGGASA